MEKLNVTLDIQVALNHSFRNKPLLAEHDGKLVAFVMDKMAKHHYVEIHPDGSVGDVVDVSLVTDLDNAGNWYRRVGTGSVNKTNIATGLRMVRKHLKEVK